MNPPPGTATEEDLIAAWEGPEKHWCELVDGTLIHRRGTFLGSVLLGRLIGELGKFVSDHEAGVLLSGSAPIRLRPGLIRCPSLSFTPWGRVPREEVPDEKVASFVPELVVEMLNEWYTAAEIDRKLADYFEAGVKRAWVIDPTPLKGQTARVYTSAKRFKELDKAGTLDGGRVLPGFKLPLADLFAAARRRKRKPR